MYQRATPQTLMDLPPGPDGIRETLKLMKTLVKAGKTNSIILNKARELVKLLPPKDWYAEVNALWTYVSKAIRYTRDIRNVETIFYPWETLQQASGDCDDKATLLASMLEAIGHPTRFIAVGFQPGTYSHVYVETLIGRNWVPLETTENVPMGWKPPGITSVMMLYN